MHEKFSFSRTRVSIKLDSSLDTFEIQRILKNFTLDQIGLVTDARIVETRTTVLVCEPIEKLV